MTGIIRILEGNLLIVIRSVSLFESNEAFSQPILIPIKSPDVSLKQGPPAELSKRQQKNN